jgi:hypothetical protein
MHRRGRVLRGRLGVRGALIAAAAASAGCLCLSATPGTPALAQTGPVSPAPVAGTPTLVDTGTTEQIRQLVDCGGTMYAVGTFTEIDGYNGTSTQEFPRNNIFSFSDTAPFTVTAWNPDVNGTVNTIAFSQGNCADAYIGGQFTSVSGTAVHNIAEVDTATGLVVPGFRDSANGQVETIKGYGDHLLVGGFFTAINNTKNDPYMAGLNPVTGKDDGFVSLAISGHETYQGVHTNPTRIYNQQLSNDGTMDLVEGDFTSVAGQPRQQIFMLNLTGTTATLTGWTSSEFGQHCGDSHPLYITSAAWSPDDSTVYVADTGYKPLDWNGTFPLTTLCDAAAAFPATQTTVSHTWVNYTGCWSLFSVAADSSAVYVGGHERFADNQNGCKSHGPGAIPAPGMGGFTPSDGALLENSAGTAGLYSRGRGLGADDMLLTSAGLWIASDNLDGTNTCGGQKGFAGICFLPY